MTQVRIVVADDASEFEDQINYELSLIEDDDIEIEMFDTKSWEFAAMILFTKENTWNVRRK